MRLIDADEVIKTIDYSNGMGGSLGKVVECVKFYAKFMVQSSPTVEERKTGKWIEKPKEEYQTFDECVCSNCGVVEYFNNGWKRFNYCPNCGAKMEGEEQ